MALFFLLLALLSLGPTNLQEVPQKYMASYEKADFSKVIEYLAKKNFEDLSLKEKLLLIECQARTAQSKKAEAALVKLQNNEPLTPEMLALAGIVFLSEGQIQASHESTNRALEMAPDLLSANITKVTLLLHLRQFKEAEKLYEKTLIKHLGWRNSYFAYLLGVEVYGASRNLQKLRLLMIQQTNRSKQESKTQAKNLEDNSKLLKKVKNEDLYHIHNDAPIIIIPFSRSAENSSKNVIDLKIKNNTYRVLLDTGNSAGWVVHNRDLADYLKLTQGGRAFTEIGTEAGIMEGYSIYARKVNFGPFQINHLLGLYVPKPRPDYFDANLNPAFIRDRVVTLDFNQKELILRTQKQFEKDKTTLSPENSVFSAWQGYKYVFTPMLVNDLPGLTMLETGAEDISIRLDFAQRKGLVLNPKIRYLADGKVYPYHETWIKVAHGPLVFNRKRAEVWPFDRIYSHLSGLTPDVIFGPQALRRCRLTFDPFANQILLER